jgi:hypothetical protein
MRLDLEVLQLNGKRLLHILGHSALAYALIFEIFLDALNVPHEHIVVVHAAFHRGGLSNLGHNNVHSVI